MVVIICFLQFLLILKYQFFYLAQVMHSHTPVVREKNRRLQPEFAVPVRRSDMNARRLTSLIGVEMKSEWPDA